MLIIIGVLLLFALVGGIFYYLVNGSFRLPSRTTKAPTSNSLSRLPTISATQSGAPAVNPSNSQVSGASADMKVYTGDGFSLNYLSNWGILTCSNSKSFEFDPTSKVDSKNVVCSQAVKGVTVLVPISAANCPGDTISLGNIQVKRSQEIINGGTEVDYRWCFTTRGKNFDITHRVSFTGAAATTPGDFAPQIEQMIATIR